METKADASLVRNLQSLRAKASKTLGYPEDSFDISELTSFQSEVAVPTLLSDSVSVNQVKLRYADCKSRPRKDRRDRRDGKQRLLRDREDD